MRDAYTVSRNLTRVARATRVYSVYKREWENMKDLAKIEQEAFEGMEYSYELMMKEIDAITPTCHFTKMIYESGESEYGYTDSWWECAHCGHTKERP